MKSFLRPLAAAFAFTLGLAVPSEARQTGGTAPRPGNAVSTVALFSARPASGDAPLTVRFVDRSIGTLTSWSWDFGDGTTSGQRNPTHVYDQGGVYAVRLTVRGPTGTDTLEKPHGVIVRSCTIGNARDNVGFPLERGEDFVPVTGDDALGFYCVYSGKAVGPSNPGLANNVSIFLLPLAGGELLIFGSGYGDPNSLVTPTRDAAHDALRIDAIVRFCMGRLPEETPLRFVAPHGHIDHINADIVREMRARGYDILEIAYHAADSALVKSLPGWTQADRALFRPLRNSTPECQEELVSYDSPLGRLWLHLRDGHTAGSIDLVLDTLGDPGNRFLLRGSGPSFGSCPIPNTREAVDPHGNVDLRAPRPGILGVTPNHGSALGGTSVLLTGTELAANLAGLPSVYFDGAPASSVSVLDDGSLTCVAPPGVPGALVDVELVNQNGRALLPGGFRYRALPSVEGLAPARGVATGGTHVTLSGSGFQRDAAGPNTVTFGGTPASAVQVLDDRTLTCTVPPGPVGTVTVALSNRNGAAELAAAFTYLPPIDVTGVSPASGTALGGSRVQLLGSAFSVGLGVPQVFFGESAGTDVVVLSDTRLNCTTPPGAGGTQVDVRVSAENGADTLPAGFRYFAEPRVISLSPASGPREGGTTVTVTGQNFTRNAAGPNTVTFGGVPATGVVTLSDTQLRCTAPPGAGGSRVDVEVSNANGSGRLPQGYRYHLPPTLSALDPGLGPRAGGTLVTLTGGAFRETDAGVPEVLFGGRAALQVTRVDDAHVTCLTPAAPLDGVVDVVLTNANGTTTLANAFRYVTRPVLSGLTPARGPSREGTQVTLLGAGFQAAGAGPPEVRFGAARAEAVRVLDDATVSCRAPLGVPGTRVTVRLTNANGTTSLPDAYDYLPLPRLTGLVPDEGAPTGGTRVTLSGGGFLDGAPRVRFGTGLATDVVVLADDRLECTTPPGTPGAVDVSVRTAGGEARMLAAFVFGSSRPVLTSLTPADGTSLGGEHVVLHGRNFLAAKAGAPQVRFDVVTASEVVVLNDERIDCRVPGGAPGSVVDVVVVNANGATTLPGGFRYHLQPTLADLSPRTGTSQGGTLVTLTGSGFLDDRAGPAEVRFAGVRATAVNVLDDTRLTCRTPAGTPDSLANVRVSNANGSALLVDAFRYLGAPTLTGLAPADGTPSGGTLVRLTGSGFDLAGAGLPSVSFGPQAATEIVVESGTSLTCRAPGGTPAAVVDVRLSNANGSATLAQSYRYRASPAITSVSPARGPAAGGTVVVLNGSGFQDEVDGPNEVTFGALPVANLLTVSDLRVRVIAPPGTPGESVDVLLSNPNGSVLVPQGFRYNALPTVTGFDPPAASALGGALVTLTGSGFQRDGAGTNEIRFGDSAGTEVTVLDDSTLTCRLPAGASGSAVPVTLTNANGSALAPAGFAYFAAPRIDEVVPPYGFSGGGALVEIRGAGFQANGAGPGSVLFAGLAASEVTVIDDTRLQCRTPLGTVGPVGVEVANANGSGLLVDGYYYDWAPTVTSVQPAFGTSLGGTQIRIEGGGFTTVGAGTLSVRFGANFANNVQVLDGQTLLCTTPAGPAGTTVNAVVWNSRGSSSAQFRYYPRPTLSSVDPSSGPPEGGTRVTVRGTGFVANGAGVPSLRFAGTPATDVVVVNDTTLTCTAPAGPARTSATLTLTNANGSGSFVDGFRWLVREPGDLNDDGVVDAVLGASEAAYVFFGSPFGLGDEGTATADVVFRSQSACDFGAAIASGDLNGDQIADLAVGAPLDDAGGTDIGAVYVFFGPLQPSPTPRLNTSASAVFRGTRAGDLFGTSLALRDVTGDGHCDLIVGAPLDDSGASDGGAVFVYRGGPGFASATTAQATVRLISTEQQSSFGTALAGGDATGDGAADLAVGAPTEGAVGGNSGAVYVFAGGSGLVTATQAGAAIRLTGANSGDHFGTSVALGDFDGDGDADVFVGAPEAKGNGVQGGQVLAFQGGPQLASTSAQNASVRLDAEVSGDRLGQGIALGDSDGDGRADLLLAAPLHDFPAANSGRVYWIRGGPLTSGNIGLRATMILVSEASVGDQLGTSLSLADLDADGRKDLLVGAPFNNGGGSDAGRVYVFLGAALQATRTAGADDLTWTGGGAQLALGRQLGGAP